MGINEIIMYIMMFFMLIAAVDRILSQFGGSARFLGKLGKSIEGSGGQFEEGFMAMGALGLAMVGMTALAPVLAHLLGPVIITLYEMLGANPSMFAGTLLACDMGGFFLAKELAGGDVAAWMYSGLILGSMMGPTIVFTIPVALSIIKKSDRPYLGAGILAGLITVPIGCIVGGLVMNMTQYKIDIITIVRNLIPVIIIAGLIVAGLWFMPDKMINGFNKFGTAVTVVITFFTAVAVFEYQTGIKFPLMNIMVEPDADGVIPLESGLLVCGQIAVVLIGAFPMVLWITRTFGKALSAIGEKLGMDENGSAGLVATLANNIAMFNIMDKMNPKGKLLNVAFAVSAAFVFGDHLGFTAGVNSDMIFPVIVGKLVAGITALILANALAPMLLSKVEASVAKAKAEEEAEQ